MHQKKQNETTLTELLKLEKSDNDKKQSKTDKFQKKKKNQNKPKKNNRTHYAIQKSKNDTFKKSAKSYEKMSMANGKNEKKSLTDFISEYVYRNRQKVFLLVSAYIIFLGAVISTPILVNHFTYKHHNQVDRFKKGFIITHSLLNITYNSF